MLSRVLELWDQVPDAAERIDARPHRRAQAAATVAHLSGEYERSIALARPPPLDELDHCVDPIRAAMLLRASAALAEPPLRRPGPPPRHTLEDLRTAHRCSCAASRPCVPTCTCDTVGVWRA
ncbi:hypothetical protein GCM10020220_018260 [Nonomuraea rubra]|uniref:hypothetical protein n=1 Tax=Nonomuraea rubra TaxID=46180 RepID=UPI0031EB1AF8